MKDFFFIRHNAKIYRIPFNDVLFIESLRNYCRIHTKDSTLLTLKSMKELEASLPEDDFIRIHKSYIVAVNKISQLTKTEVCLDKRQCFPVGETFRTRLQSFVGGRLL